MATTVVQARPATASSHNAANDLSRLLFRLESILLNPTPSNVQLRLLRRSQFERNRVNANVEHARSLLFHLEHDTPSRSAAPSSSKHQQTPGDRKADIQHKRALLKKLQAALDELNHLPPDPADSTPLSTLLHANDAEDLVALYGDRGPTPTSAPVAVTPEPPQSTATLRARKPTSDPASTTGALYTGSASLAPPAQTTAPFAPRSTRQDHDIDKSTAQLLEAHDSQQTNLTDSLLDLAGRLKESTSAFRAALDEGDPLLDAAAKGLDANVAGLDAAGQRMSRLRRMAEGKGWLARMGLYGWIGALWVALVLLVFVFPKLRFR